MTEMTTAKDFMKTDFSIVKSTDQVIDAVNKLLKSNSAVVFVADDDDNIIGLFNEFHGIKPIIDSIYYEVEGNIVKDDMDHIDAGISADEDIIDIAQIFLKSKHHTLGVFKDSEIIGYITCLDLLRALYKEEEKNEDYLHNKQAPVIGKWADRFKSEGGSALPKGFQETRDKDEEQS